MNFYRLVYGQVPPDFRPDVKSVRYASPGWLDVQLLLEAAIEVGKAVGVVATAMLIVAKAYNEIYRGLQERKLLGIATDRRRLRLSRDEIAFVEKSSQKLSKLMGFKNFEQLNKLTNNNLASLKILMSYYRRIRILVGFVEKGKANFPMDEG